MKAIFKLGAVFITSNAASALSCKALMDALERHAFGDWGDVCYDDWNRNGLALGNGKRIVSTYHDLNGRQFWIITEENRRQTIVLLPEDYQSFHRQKQKVKQTPARKTTGRPAR